MKGERGALLSAVDLQPTLDMVEQGVALDFAQYSLLRDSADAKLYGLMKTVNASSVLNAADRENSLQDFLILQDTCQRVSHLLQTSCLALRRLQLDHKDQRLAREALESQLAYMQACLRRSLASFDRSA
ncbi:hypothetical protein I5Q41_10845 [Pseudomonas monteilii]|jgi:hypothetical protein|uniref:Uncharacterized protein n=2 Tax=Pseudomonas putida group TaxID=136845 RepID=A0AAE6RDV4_9PSED|nr:MULTISPECIES: hypothetical protein [Pseudomonas]MBB3273012.1 hypothetical protein [Pseudomonas sp. OG7]MBH3394072.1 hypothetical protein [Pseudomonas monteilii]MBH3455192.1 hypothetical protein [Pseudomonas monteilii]MCJ7851062.1 hypothetical protein [Pseudomonas monteilii]MDD2125131.1 hypothetical protein [Pseudomonas monteilii]